MKRLAFFSLCAAMMLLAACDKGATKGLGFEVESIAFQAVEGGEWGLMDVDGKVVVKPRYDNMPTCAINGMFSVYDVDRSIYTLYQVGANPKEIGEYKDIGAFTGKLCPIVDKNYNISYIDKEGNKVLKMKKLNGKKVVGAFNFFEGRAMVMLEDSKWGFIDEAGKLVIPCKYDDAWNFCEGLAVVYVGMPGEDEDAKWQVIDREGNVIFSRKFSDLTPNTFCFSSGCLTATDDGGRIIIINKQGEVETRLKEGRFPSPIYNGLFTVYNIDSDLNGLMNTDGELVMKEKYEQLIYNGKLLVGRVGGGRPYLYSTAGEKLTKLPEGNVALLDPEFRGSDKRLIVGDDDSGYQLLDAEGKKIAAEAEIYSYGVVYFWGASLPGIFSEYGDDDDEPDYGGAPDYDEEVELVEEEEDEAGAVG